jgi:hypothetical protein
MVGRQIQTGSQFPPPGPATALRTFCNERRQFPLPRHFAAAEIVKKDIGQEFNFRWLAAAGRQAEKQLIQPQGGESR